MKDAKGFIFSCLFFFVLFVFFVVYYCRLELYSEPLKSKIEIAHTDKS